MTKNIVLCLDGTNNSIGNDRDTNVVRLHRMLDLTDPARQVGYYDAGVGNLTPTERALPIGRHVFRVRGLALGAGLQQNLAEAYTYLINNFDDGDKVHIFGFSRGAYTARALAGMLEVYGVFRADAANVVPEAVAIYSYLKPRPVEERVWRRIAPRWFERRYERRLLHYQRAVDTYVDAFSRHRTRGVTVGFMGLWDTVEAAGTPLSRLRWPGTRRLINANAVRHALALDERRFHYPPYLIDRCPENESSVQEVWFAGRHSDVGGAPT